MSNEDLVSASRAARACLRLSDEPCGGPRALTGWNGDPSWLAGRTIRSCSIWTAAVSSLRRRACSRGRDRSRPVTAEETGVWSCSLCEACLADEQPDEHRAYAVVHDPEPSLQDRQGSPTIEQSKPVTGTWRLSATLGRSSPDQIVRHRSCRLLGRPRTSAGRAVSSRRPSRIRRSWSWSGPDGPVSRVVSLADRVSTARFRRSCSQAS
jgi:hypothetical protein